MSQQSIKKNTVFNSIKTVSSILFPLITFPYVSRTLLLENVGKINFSASVVSYFSLIASLGIQTYAIRECSAVRDDREKLSGVASQIYSINIITTVAAYIALAITLIFFQRLENYRVLIIIQSLSIAAATLGADWLNSAMEDFKYITIRSIVFQFVGLAFMFIFVHKPEDYIKYALISLISGAGAEVVNMWYRRRYCSIRFIVNIVNGIEWKKHMIPIIYLFAMILAQTIFNSVDSTMLGLIHGDREVGIYAVANKMSNIIVQLVASILWVIMPRMSLFFAEEDYVQVNSLLRKILGFNVLLGLPCAVGTFMLADEMVIIISGIEFAEAAGVLRILMIGFIFKLFGEGFLGNMILLPSKKEKIFMVVCCVAAAVNVITNYIFIPRYGVIAAAGTTALCAFLIFVFLLFTIDKKIRIERISALFFTPVIGCIGIAAVCFVCKLIPSLWIRTILSMCLSVGVYFFVNYIGKNELLTEFVNSFINRFLKH